MNEENKEGADPTSEEAAEKLGELIGGLFSQITGVLASQQALREVQSVLLLRLGEAVMHLQIKAGLLDEASRLAETFGMAAAVLNASKEASEEAGDGG